MLIAFTVGNYKSIREKQTLTFMANAAGEHPENRIRITPNGKTALLKSNVIYGPNASGKSNLMSAMAAMQSVVLSLNHPGIPLPVVPFLLDPVSRLAPTFFEIILSLDGKRFQYGFSCTKERIISEWLYVYPKITGRAQTWFERSFNEDLGDCEWQISPVYLNGERNVWKNTTAPNRLFLTNAVIFNSTGLKPLYDWFAHGFRVIRGSQIDVNDPVYTAALFQDPQYRNNILEFVKVADDKIKDLAIRIEPLKEHENPLRETMDTAAIFHASQRQKIDIHSIHEDSDGEKIDFDFKALESEGTKRLLCLAGPIIDALHRGMFLAVDELNISLHPNIMQFLIGLFHNESVNPRNAQLLLTTHETSVLDQKIFRRDQIWFTEIAKEQSTKLFPLTDLKPLKGSKENLREKYLGGRYGALPRIAPFVEEAISTFQK